MVAIAELTRNQFVNHVKFLKLQGEDPTNVSRKGEENGRLSQPKKWCPITSEILAIRA